MKIKEQKAIVAELDKTIPALKDAASQAGGQFRATNVKYNFFFYTRGIPWTKKDIAAKEKELKELPIKMQTDNDWRLRRRYGNVKIWHANAVKRLADQVAELEKRRQALNVVYDAYVKAYIDYYLALRKRTSALDTIQLLEDKLKEMNGGRLLYGYFDENIKYYLGTIKFRPYYTHITMIFGEKFE